jgi:hypothetical protein
MSDDEWLELSQARADVARLTKAIERACGMLKDGRHPFEALHVLERAIGPQHSPWSNTVESPVGQ